MIEPDLLRQAHQLLAERTTNDRHLHTEDPNDPATVQAMQIALHIPKADPPARTALLEAAAQAVVMVCLDSRAVTDDDWNAGLRHWYDRLIRKVARRARNKPWNDAQGVPGVTATVEGAQARAFVPTSVAEVPAAVKKLQIRGTDLEPDEPAPIDPDVPLIVVDKALHMSTGKAAAQVGHGSMLLAAQRPFEWVLRWLEAGLPLQVRGLEGAELAQLAGRDDAVAVRDAGFTEIAPDSLTVVAVPGNF